MKRLCVIACIGIFSAASHAASLETLLAKEQTAALSEADRLVAARAEQEALERDEPIRSFEWKGPDGASGLIIVSGEFAHYFSLGRCRNFVHIVRHPKDGGVNPTLEASVCRDWEGRWSVRRDP